MSLRIEPESYVDKIVAQTRASEAEVVKDFGKFDLWKDGLYYPDTMIWHKGCIFASGKDGRIYIWSKKHNRCLVFDGAGGEYCTQIMVKNDVLH